MEKILSDRQDPGQREDWPEDFWKAFEGIPEDFERPIPVKQQRESASSCSISE